MQNIDVFGIKIPPAVYIPLLYMLWVSVFLFLKLQLYSKVKVLAQKTKTEIDDIFLSSLELPLVLIIFVSGIFVLENIFSFTLDSELLRIVDIAFKATAIIAVILFVDRFLNSTILHYSKSVEVLQTSSGVIRIVIRSIVLGLGVLIILDSFGVSIAPILASLGIGSLAVALALQPTLENFFSGIQIVVDKPIKVGHYIKLESGEEGYVERIGWRSTWVKMLQNNTIVIPNKVMGGSRILNYYYPSKEMALLVNVGVDYRSDLEHVERVTIEVAKDILKTIPGGVTEFEPFIRYHTFNDFSIDFTVILRVKEFVDGYLVKHEFVKRLHKRYEKEGITIPFPIRTLEWSKDQPHLKISQEK